MPTVSAEIDVVVRELHAKRLSIQALQAELAALDEQLELLERSLAPLEAWNNQWSRIRTSLVDTLGGGGGR
jgi:prefoldin subunit 5